ncbi:MAG TPA: energy transducer TonB, partial [Bacteroidales bacterium]|nr:energy transducer TonB [Bacteroidales bacterium]
IMLAIVIISMPCNSQSIQKAKYLKEDLDRYLLINTKYPDEAMISNIQGDVVYSFTVNKIGRLENLALMNYPKELLLNSSRTSMSSLSGEWKPALINDNPVDKKYQIVFRFRIYFDTKPYDYKGQSKKLVEKQKNEKALKALDDGIEDNNYDYELYYLRSKVKTLLGDSEGSKKDEDISNNLKDEIMTIVDVTPMLVRRTVPLGVTKVVVSQQ